MPAKLPEHRDESQPNFLNLAKEPGKKDLLIPLTPPSEPVQPDPSLTTSPLDQLVDDMHRLGGKKTLVGADRRLRRSEKFDRFRKEEWEPKRKARIKLLKEQGIILTPLQLKARLRKVGWKKNIAYQEVTGILQLLEEKGLNAETIPTILTIYENIPYDQVIRPGSAEDLAIKTAEAAWSYWLWLRRIKKMRETQK